jgi:type I site-specific restriction endonuclease
LIDLNLPKYNFKIKAGGKRQLIFDEVRRKFVALTPEEWVRQHFLRFLTDEKKYPASRMAVEFALTYNTLSKRGDIVFFGKSGSPELIVECKAPSVKISQDTFDQAARYNFILKVKHLIITNGLEHFCCEMDHAAASYKFLPDIPEYTEP